MTRISLHPLLISPPEYEPVTLNDLKDFLHIDADEDNSLLQTFLAAARLRLEATNGQLMIHQVWRFTLHIWPTDGFLVLPFHPVVEVLQSRVFDANSTPSFISVAEIGIDTTKRLPRLVLPNTLPKPGRMLGGIEIDIKFGFSDNPDEVPEVIRLAILELAAHWYESRASTHEEFTFVPRRVLNLLKNHNSGSRL